MIAKTDQLTKMNRYEERLVSAGFVRDDSKYEQFSKGDFIIIVCAYDIIIYPNRKDKEFRQVDSVNEVIELVKKIK